VSDPYTELTSLAERERDLAVAGKLDELEPVQEARRALMDGLPGVPPPRAEPALRRMAELQGEVTAALQEAARVTAGELARIDRGRGAVRGYARPAPGQRLVDSSG